jgi:hypothetical protein
MFGVGVKILCLFPAQSYSGSFEGKAMHFTNKFYMHEMRFCISRFLGSYKITLLSFDHFFLAIVILICNVII